MQGIKTTQYGLARVRATCGAKTIIIPRDYTLSWSKQYRAAAMELAQRLGWTGTWHGATVPGVVGMVWVPGCHNVTDSYFHLCIPKEE